MANVAYIRVSTGGQSLDSQKDALNDCQIDRWFEEKASGLDDARPVLKECLGYLREGDTLYMTRADRLARSSGHLLAMVETLRKKGVEVAFVEQPELSTNTAHGELMLTVLAGVAKFETRLRAERCAEGIEAAKARGVKFGRPAKVTPELIAKLKNMRLEGLGVAEMMKLTGLGRSTVFKAMSEAS